MAGGYFMLGGPDNVLIEVFEPGVSREQVVRDYYGFGACSGSAYCQRASHPYTNRSIP